jgi:CRP-like cAMP-binding protein
MYLFRQATSLMGALVRQYVEVAGQSPEPFARFIPAVKEAWRQGPLTDFSPRATCYLLQDAREKRLVAGDALPLPPSAPREMTTIWMIVGGLVRTFRVSGARQLTTRYAGPGDFVGIPAAVRHGSSAHGEVVADVHALQIPASRLRELIRHDADSAWVVMGEMARLHEGAVDLAADNVFLSVRERVARHLLDLAMRDEDQGLVVAASHQDIADAIGSVREVVSRVMGEMRSEGLVGRSGDRIVLTDPARLVTRRP